jgi:hypothetical protein
MKNREFHTATMVLISALWLASCGGNQSNGGGIASIEKIDSQLFSSLSTPSVDTAVEAAG